MNCPSRPDDIEDHPGWNQNPSHLNADATTRADLNGIVNLREQREAWSSPDENMDDRAGVEIRQDLPPKNSHQVNTVITQTGDSVDSTSSKDTSRSNFHAEGHSPSHGAQRNESGLVAWITKARQVLIRYAQFVGPGFLIAVAYIDPGNYATDVQAGAETRFSLLFIILMSNLFAIFLQTLAIRLGSVTGLDLAENCRKHMPRWATISLYALSETAIIATDIAEVIGSAIALNLLLHIPLVAGCALTLVDVLLLLLFYNPDGSMTRLRIFEYLVALLVLGVMVCFCIQLSYIQDTAVGEVFKGYLPSAAVVSGNGIYLSCGILGATVMPHSIFLGSGIVQPRLRQFDEVAGIRQRPDESGEDEEEKYKPSIRAIQACMKYSIAELATSLFTFALFINSAILIVAGSSLYNNPAAGSADLFGIYHLLSNLAPAAATIFALALLLSGTSAGIVCTMAGQMVSEGMLNWSVRPWIRRLVTRSISIVPSIVIAGAVGRTGLGQALTASQVVLSVILPFVTAPLIWFTSRGKFMTVQSRGEDGLMESRNMRCGYFTTAVAVLIWLVLVVMNMALLVLIGKGRV